MADREPCTATYGDVECWRERGHSLQHHGSEGPGLGNVWWETGDLPPEPNPVPASGSAQSVLRAVQDAKPPGVDVVGVVLNDATVKRPWRWAPPVALWLLRRAGYQVIR